jgi:hypothetical protein
MSGKVCRRKRLWPNSTQFPQSSGRTKGNHEESDRVIRVTVHICQARTSATQVGSPHRPDYLLLSSLFPRYHHAVGESDSAAT